MSKDIEFAVSVMPLSVLISGVKNTAKFDLVVSKTLLNLMLIPIVGLVLAVSTLPLSLDTVVLTTP
jgi:hypothetical protein